MGLWVFKDLFDASLGNWEKNLLKRNCEELMVIINEKSIVNSCDEIHTQVKLLDSVHLNDVEFKPF